MYHPLKVLPLMFLALLVALSIPGDVRATEQVGYVSHVEGTATLVSGAGDSVRLRVNSPIALKDRITTRDGSKVQITFIDDTLVVLDSDSEFVIDEYFFKPGDTNSRAVLTAIKGIFRVITGKMAKIAPKRFMVNSKIANIGQRGTSWGFTLHHRDYRGLLVVLFTASKGIYVANEAGRVDLTKPREFTRVLSATQAPSKPASMAPATINKIFAPVTTNSKGKVIGKAISHARSAAGAEDPIACAEGQCGGQGLK